MNIMNNSKKSNIVILLGIFFTCVLVSCSVNNRSGSNEQEITTESSEYKICPTEKWEHSIPENEGVSSDTLSELYEKYGKQGTILIVRNGKILAENYPAPFDTCYLHHIFSCTKSVTSILTGIAIDKGYFNLNDSLLSFFPEYTFKNVDSRKKAITIHHLLAMSSGFKWKDGIGGKDLLAMLKTSDWTQTIIDPPMLHEPGTHFNYSCGDTQLLSTIIQRKTGTKMEDFAKENLFAPLGIKNYKWDYKNSYHGITPGPWGLYLSVRDMAKIGYLYLNEGKWDTTQVVTKEWVEKSVSVQTSRGKNKDAYGYQWWIIDGLEYYTYTARGWYGNRYAFINVIPDLDIVVAVAGNIDNGQNYNILKQYIIPSVIKN
jgi:CubicO group peptidase (beta-lactamase class C family)